MIPLLNRKNSVKVNHRIYCSDISREFLINRYGRETKRYIERMTIDKETKVRVFDKRKKEFYYPSVTAISANHCPGSVMFLFEHEDLRTLYTGDFRFENIRLESIESLHHIDGTPLPIDQMYLDATFCSKEYKTFPSRDDAIEATWNLVNEWIRKNGMYRNQRPKHVVLFDLPAQYGSEAILKRLHEKSNRKWKIHVNTKKSKDYLNIQELHGIVDDNFAKAEWIHACPWDKNDHGSHIRQLPCYPGNIRFSCSLIFHAVFLAENPYIFFLSFCFVGQYTVRRIKPSAMFFTQTKLSKSKENTTYEEYSEFYRVCFSAHSSMDELLEFVNYFKPKSIVPIAKPKHLTAKEVIEMLSVSEDVQISSQELMRSTPLQTYQPENPLLLEVTKNVLKNKRKLKRPSEDEGQNDELESCNSQLEARRKRFKATRLDRVTCSMPVMTDLKDFNDKGSEKNEQSRRASLPANIKIPEITITPSTPSPDEDEEDKSPEHFNFPGVGKMDLDNHEEEIMSTESDLNSTPDFEEVLASASNEEERKNVLKYGARTSTL